MKKIIILGGGFAGLGLAVHLAKLKLFDITVIDKEDYHLFTPNLYEVASASEEMVTMGELKESIALPFRKISEKYRINFIQAEVKSVNSFEKFVEAKAKKFTYDYLVLAQGSIPEYFCIPGAEQFALPLKTLPQALRIKNQIEFAVESHKFDIQKPYVRIVVAGGGYTGVEVAGGLASLLDFLAWKYGYPREKILVEIVEASNTLMPGMGDRASKDAQARLKELGITVRVLSPIVQVESSWLELKSGEKMVYDCLIWTVGVRAQSVPLGLSLPLDGRGRVETNTYLQTKTNSNIFVIGDQALVLGNNGQSAPPSAQDAEHQAKYLAKALPKMVKNQLPPSYEPVKHGFIVSLGSKWAILNYQPFYWIGWLAYIIDKLAHIKYFASIIGWKKAVKYVCFQTNLYERKD